MDDRQLRWTVANRRKGGRAERLGKLLDGLPMNRWVRQAQRNGALVQVLVEQLGEDTMRRVSIGGIRRGILVLEVPDAGDAYLMQLNHSLLLAEAIRAAVPGAGITDVRFRPRKDRSGPEMTGGR